MIWSSWIFPGVIGAVIGVIVGILIYRSSQAGRIDFVMLGDMARYIIAASEALYNEVGEHVQPEHVALLARWMYPRIPLAQQLMSEDEFVEFCQEVLLNRQEARSLDAGLTVEMEALLRSYAR